MSNPNTSLSTNAVILAVDGDVPKLRTVDKQGRLALPSGVLEETDRTIQESIRRWVMSQTGLELGYVEQLYTFGDADRVDAQTDSRLLSIAYIALVHVEDALDESWASIYDLFPWEDARSSEALMSRLQIAQQLLRGGGQQQLRAKIAFGEAGTQGDGVRALERYELMYEAGLLAEAGGSKSYGQPMYLDHRRIAATALSRIRGKITYRPVVFELLPERFTLRELQTVVEALSGERLHTQNFRRLVESGGLVAGTGEMVTPPKGGRPAELFSFRSEVLFERPKPGLK